MTEISANPESPASPSRSRADAAVDLLLRPERFFEALLRTTKGSLPWLVIWVCGAARVVDNIDTRLMTGTLRSDAPLLTSWSALWGGVIFGAFLAGPLNWLIGGWWYRMRMVFSGARRVNKRRARLVYMHAQLVWCVPSLVWLILVTGLYSDYHAAYAASPFSLAFIPIVPWSTWVSYRGVRHCFDLKTGRARVWFLILPLTIYAAIVGAVWIRAWFGPF